MKISVHYIKLFSAVVLLTALLSWFYYAHETFPKPLRAATALLETPVAIASGLSHYLNLGIPVYESLAAVIIVNLAASIILILLIDKIILRRKRKS